MFEIVYSFRSEGYICFYSGILGNNTLKIAELLIDSGADMNPPTLYSLPLHTAAMHGRLYYY